MIVDRPSLDQEGVTKGEPLIGVLHDDVVAAALLPAEPAELGADPLLGEHLKVRPVQQTARGHVPPAADELGGEVEVRHVRDARHQNRGVVPVVRQ